MDYYCSRLINLIPITVTYTVTILLCLTRMRKKSSNVVDESSHIDDSNDARGIQKNPFSGTLRTTDNKISIPASIYFGGAAYASSYYIGVYKGMLERWGHDFSDKTVISADSAGVIFLLVAALKHTPEHIEQLYLQTARQNAMGLFSPNGLMHLEALCLRELVHESAMQSNVLDRLNQGCYVGYSTFFDNHVWVTRWSSIEDFIRCARHSMHIPLLVPSNSRSNVVEGGFCCKGSDLVHGNETMFIGDDPTADVSIGMSAGELMYGSQGEQFQRMVRIGYDAFMQWDGKLKKKVGLRKTKYAVQTLLWCLKTIELVIDAAQFVFQHAAGNVLFLLVTILLLIGLAGSLI